MRVSAERPPLPLELERWLEPPLLDELDCWLAACAPLLLCLREELALRARVLRPLDELPRELPLPDARELPLRLLPLLLPRELALRLLPLLRELAARVLPPLLRELPLRELALRLLPLLPLLPLLRLLPLRLLALLGVLPLLDPLAFWFLVLPRVPWLRVPLLLLDERRLLERLEEPRPLVADIVHLLLFDSHVQTNSAGAGLSWLYPAIRAITTQSGQMVDALQDALLDG